MSGYNPGTGPYNNPQITIANPLAPIPQQWTNVGSLLQTNSVGTWIFLNGLLMTRGLDYTISGSLVTFTNAPLVGDQITAKVFQLGDQLGGANPQRYVAPNVFAVAGPLDGVGLVYQIQIGPTIFGLTDGTNNLFVVGCAMPRWQIWRNGVLQTYNVDVVAGQTAFVFLPGAIPQPGDILTALGYSNC